MIHRVLPLVAPLLAALATPAVAANTSAYTDVDLDACTVIAEDELGATWRCEGYDGMMMQIAEGDLRMFVSYGENAGSELAAQQTPPPFNSLGQKIEWRLNADGEPFATILRFFVDRSNEGKPEAQVLIVTRLEEGATCHVAYIDATANQNANELARKAADDLAADFDCANSPEIIGKFEAWQL
jgi:hypothetical protein